MFEKEVTFSPAFDKRNDDPKKNYGIGAVQIRFVLKGPKGATQLILGTDWYPAHVQREFAERGQRFTGRDVKPDGWDIGYHSPRPMYEDQSPMEKCDVLGCECYYDGSSLRAMKFVPTFLEGGSDAVWKMLEEVYRERFGEEDDAPTTREHAVPDS